MVPYLIRRLLFMAFVLVGVSALTFVLSQVIPGDPARAAAGPDAPEATVRAIRAQMGLNRPLLYQYARYMRGLAVGDLRRSIVSGQPVLKDLLTYYPATIELAVASIVFSCLVGIPAGVLAALRRGQFADQGTRVVALFAISMPVFWLGLIYQLIFYGRLQWLPAAGQVGETLSLPHPVTGFLLVDGILLGRPDVLLSALRHLVLPMLALSSITLAEVARITRASVLDVLSEQYVGVARAKGLSEGAVIVRHILRNAATPILTMLGLRFGQNLSGAVLVETIFSWPGVGRYAVQAIDNKDFPAIMGVALTVALLYSLVNLLVDLAYAWSDPRIAVA